MNNNRSVFIIDRPCGSGKTTQMINSFNPNKRYLVVTPLLTECTRIVRAAKVAFMQPEVIADDPEIDTKKEHLIQLLEAGSNVVTTHAMFDSLATVARGGWLDDYEILIDEVMSVIDDSHRVTKKSWDDFYLGKDYVTVNPETRMVTPTDKWDEYVDEVGAELNKHIYNTAKSGRLYNIIDGINIALMPEVLLKAGKSLTVYTYKAEGSIMYAYLKRLGLEPVHDKGDIEVEQKFIRQARELITVKAMPTLEGLRFSYTGQTKHDSAELNIKVPKALASLRNNSLSDVHLDNILITCPKEKWYHKGKAPIIDVYGLEKTPFRPGPYSIGCKMAPRNFDKLRATWVPNTTRGTNDYRHCTHAIYLYDQFLNPNILNFLGGKSVISNDDYALTELIQWLWRTQIRDGKPITVYIPSKRMRDLFLNWLWDGNVPTDVRDKLAQRSTRKR